MMEGGFSQLETIRSTQTDQEGDTSRYSGSVGVSNVFAFLGISLGADCGSQKGSASSQEVTAERVHTPNSLFEDARAAFRRATYYVRS